MSYDWIEILNSLAIGLGTVFVGLLTLMGAMKLMVLLVARQQARSRAREEAAARAPATGQGPPADSAPGDGSLSGELMAAITIALHLDALALEELEAQRLTWTRMFKPFSPWLMDAKNSLHTHRIRYRAHGSTGRILRERPLR
jgi:Na+-transporting methylmalonyl-CoA/oxaloacetate decarboxylase gamma subunit